MYILTQFKPTTHCSNCSDSLRYTTVAREKESISATMVYERPEHTLLMEFFFAQPFAQYTPRVVAPPEGVIEAWQFFFRLAAASGHPVKFAGRTIDPADTQRRT